MIISIDLQEGFNNDKVEILINGAMLYEKENVSTRYQIGLADRFEADIAGSQAEIEINLPEKKINKKITLSLDRNIYIGFSIKGKEEIEHVVKEDEFHYM
jgi:hypothetical protein